MTIGTQEMAMTKPTIIHFKSAGARRMPAPDYSTKRGEAFVAQLIEDLKRTEKEKGE